ncbi:ParB/RepB/Spo0J family partition protein [Psychrobium sp. 1_MG-2023]|uniref:ParB/RepB/Spo0J family partition protein n=1 Tax=Psychrobium sp. 1_MG-2023 TaxID=3062624 RepID=UPI000C34601B|nr:ParB/RepB/Spo0J family partition protein [Psychrobium sp. 1_MG-2023]MDP2560457.1 ParB/RepB/Spo0J family partition protein [Psychrobium sp. 1_MG-2023]PKF57883.1 chromosome partitioning protein ParB [Alteromonadales bacterium alter-6D02]
MSLKKRGLGKGLDALLSTSNTARTKQIKQDVEQAPVKEQISAEKGELQQLPIEFLQPGVYQPRKDMSSDALDELASSIKAQGIIQPILVRQVGEDKYEIIAGERRWRAAQLAQLTEVPCLVKDVDDRATVAIALIENIQREDLNAMEEAVALDRLINEFELTHQQVAEEVGKSRTTVSNLLRLNTLNDDVKLLLERGDIDMGHARALLGLSGELQSDNARVVADKNLSVRETERLVQKALKGTPEKKEKTLDPNIASLQQRLSEHLGAKVAINDNGKGKGKMVISYTTLDELDGLLGHIGISHE